MAGAGGRGRGRRRLRRRSRSPCAAAVAHARSLGFCVQSKGAVSCVRERVEKKGAKGRSSGCDVAGRSSALAGAVVMDKKTGGGGCVVHIFRFSLLAMAAPTIDS